MTTKSWLRDKAMEQAEQWAECGEDWRIAGKNGTPCTHCQKRVYGITDAIEQVAREFAERAIEEVLDHCYENGIPQHTKADRELREMAIAAAEKDE